MRYQLTLTGYGNRGVRNRITLGKSNLEPNLKESTIF